MFGFGARKKYDQEVTARLNNDFKIITDNTVNTSFPAILWYYKFLDEAWAVKGSTEEAAARMAILYCCSLLKDGNDADRLEAKGLLVRIRPLLTEYLGKGAINQEGYDRYTGVLDKYSQ